ncbi:hypothetical protein T4D_3472 [Trichinella pseudospiralis]|uniref:Uncharacterized protein n=1 Tax=Trichinella pseudospiralis TaxID=6337 RepID=A0A0V1FM57_TRIPS|nr:hypothetical protein T4D_3472 [Trichinella pseudospiralis]
MLMMIDQNSFHFSNDLNFQEEQENNNKRQTEDL